jgi:hypothetical protein
VLKKLQIAFCILIGLGIVVFFVAMITNVNVPVLPKWLGPVAWGSFGMMVACSLGVVVTLALERERKPKPVREEAEPESEDAGESEHHEESESPDAGESEAGEGELPVESESLETEVHSGEAEAHEQTETAAHEQTIDYVPHPEADTFGEAAGGEEELNFDDFK